MIRAADLLARDHKRRGGEKYPPGAYLAPLLPTPRDRGEQYALNQIREYQVEHCAGARAVTLHVYIVLELINRAWLDGLEAGRHERG